MFFKGYKKGIKSHELLRDINGTLKYIPIYSPISQVHKALSVCPTVCFFFYQNCLYERLYL